MLRSLHSSVPARAVASAALAALLAACGGDEAPSADASAAAPSADAAPSPPAAAAGEMAAGGPPPGRYVCRQYTTTMGYLTIGADGSYEVSGVRGRYRHDPATGALEWEGGSYDEWGWEGRYEHVARPAGDGRPDEDVVRLVSESDGLKIDCFRMDEA